MKKFIQVLALLMIITSLVLAGCQTSPAPVEPRVEEIAAPAEAEEAEDEEAEAEEVETTEVEVLGHTFVRFSSWDHDPGIEGGNMTNFHSWVETDAAPTIKVGVEWNHSGFGQYEFSVEVNSTSGNQLDVLYGSDHWLAKWVTNGWVLPLEDYWSAVTDYVSDIEDFSVDAMTYKGKLYGLPIYTDVMYFFYNTKMLEDAGIASPPTTWEEVTEQSLILIEKGVTDTPLMLGLSSISWSDLYYADEDFYADEVLYALVYSEGGKFFDEDLNVVFETNSGPVFDVIEWLASALNDDQIMPKSVLEMTAVDTMEAFKAGDTAFVIVPGYLARELSMESLPSVAGYTEVAMMPGTTHETVGYTRMYLLGSGAIKSEERLQAAIHLIEFMGGKTTFEGEEVYHAVKRRAVLGGLGFSIHSLWSDPEVNDAFAKMADTNILQEQKVITRSKEGMGAPWFSDWILFVQTETQNAILRQVTTVKALENIANYWEDLKSE